MGLQRVGHNWATELNWTELRRSCILHLLSFAHPHNTSFTMLDARKKAEEPPNCRTPLRGYWHQPVTVFDKTIAPLFLVTDPWLSALILYKTYILSFILSLDSSRTRGAVLEAGVYCAPLCISWALKPPFYYLQTLSLCFLFGGQREPRFWPAASPTTGGHLSHSTEPSCVHTFWERCC